MYLLLLWLEVRTLRDVLSISQVGKDRDSGCHFWSARVLLCCLGLEKGKSSEDEECGDVLRHKMRGRKEEREGDVKA